MCDSEDIGECAKLRLVSSKSMPASKPVICIAGTNTNNNVCLVPVLSEVGWEPRLSGC